MDASLLVRLASGGQWAEEIDAKLVEWVASGEELHAPDLLFYEIESALRRMVFDCVLTEARAITGLEDVASIALILHPHPRDARLLRMAGRQGTRAAYDAAYLVLAEDLAAEMWTADRRLGNNGRSIGIRARFIGDSGSKPPRTY